MLSRRQILIGAASLCFAASPAFAAKSLTLTDEQKASVQLVSDYINGFQHLRGEFTQISPKGNLSRGVFHISKPGLMRFEYAPPNPFLIVSDGRWLTIKNRAKEKGDQFPLSQTPLRLVLNDKVDLMRDTDIIDFQKTGDLITLTVEDKKDSLGGGQLILVFDSARKALQQWVVVDGKNRRTTVTLENIVAGETPDPELFVVKINRKENISK